MFVINVNDVRNIQDVTTPSPQKIMFVWAPRAPQLGQENVQVSYPEEEDGSPVFIASH